MLLKPISVSRKNDAVISVCQDNENQSIEIKGINSAAEGLLGYHHSEVTGQDLRTLLPADLSDDISSFVEFQAGAKDVAGVLGRMRNFTVVSKDGLPLPIALKVFTIMSEDMNHPCFELLMRDNSRRLLQEAIDDILSQVGENGLAGGNATMSVLELVTNHQKTYNLDVCFGIVEINNFQAMLGEYSTNTINQIINEAGKRFRECCRDEDMITHLDGGRMGVFIFDCTEENAKIVLNRLRMTMNRAPFEVEGYSVPVTISASYTPVAPHQSPAMHMQMCSSILDQHKDEAGDKVYSSS